MARAAIDKLVSIEPDPVFYEQLRASFPHLSVVQGTIGDLDERCKWGCYFEC